MDYPIGETIRNLRTAKNLTQEQLAQLLCISGQSISKWETGLSLPDIQFLPPLARIFGVSIDALFGETGALDDGPAGRKAKTHDELAAELGYGRVLTQDETDGLFEGAEPLKAAGRRVLVVDDAAFMRQVQAQLLADAGFVVAGEAANGPEAVEAAEALAPDLVLMDIVMPGMDGLEAARRILEKRPQTVVVACSAMAYAPVVRQARETGLAGFIAKPFKPEFFSRRMKMYVEEGRQ